MVHVSAVAGAAAPQAMSGASARQPLSQKYNAIFSQLTTPGSGVVTKNQFTQAFSSLNMPASFQAMGANAVFSALDPSNSGAVSRQSFIQGLAGLSSQINSSGNSGG